MVNGVLTPGNEGEFTGVDTESERFRDLNEYFKATAVGIRHNELERRGDSEMVRDVLTKYWSEAQRNEAIEQRSAEIAIRAIKKELSFELISEITGLEAEKIQKLKSEIEASDKKG